MENRIQCDGCSKRFKNVKSLSTHKSKFHKAQQDNPKEQKHITVKELFLKDKDNIVNEVGDLIIKQNEMAHGVLRSFTEMEQDRDRIRFEERECVIKLADGVHGLSKIIRSLLNLGRELS